MQTGRDTSKAGSEHEVLADPHGDWWDANEIAVQRFEEADRQRRHNEADAFGREFCRLDELIVNTPAKTPEGAAAQLRVAIRYLPDHLQGDEGDPYADLILSAVRNAERTLQQFSGE